MDGLDVISSSGFGWPATNSIGDLQQTSGTWVPCDMDNYHHPLEEHLSDSDSSLDSPNYGFYFNPVEDAAVNSDPVDPTTTAEAQTWAMAAQNMDWTYENETMLAQVASPNSISTDSETIEANLDFVVQPSDESDENSMQYDEDSTGEEESYSSSLTEGTSTVVSVDEDSASAPAAPAAAVSTRPQRVSARGEHLKQVQEMIRQVNSAVDPNATVVATTRTVKKVASSNATSTASTASTAINHKKRARVEPDIRSVTLTREQLLTMTSEELDEFTNRLKADHPLTTHELRELKRQRRLIKNREYAQASRVKKKNVLSDLGVKFNELEDERSQLLGRITLLETENAKFRQQLGLPPANHPPLRLLGGLTYPPAHSSGSHHTAKSSKDTSASSTIHFSSNGDLPLPMPRAKRTRGRPSATTIGTSLFAIVLLAFAFNFAGFSSPISMFSRPAPLTAPQLINSNPLINSHLSSSQDFNTFRKMDILSTPDHHTHHAPALDSPGPSLDSLPDGDQKRAEIHLPIDVPLAASTTTIVTMDDVLAAEDIIFTTNVNDTITHQPELIQVTVTN